MPEMPPDGSVDGKILIPVHTAEVRDHKKIPMHKDMRNLLIINSLYNFFTGFASPFIAIFFNNFGSIDEVGISVSLLYIIQGIISLFFIKFVSRFGSKRVVVLAQISEGIRVMMFLLARSVYDVYLLQIIGGLIAGLNAPAYASLFVNVCSDESSSSIGANSSLPTLTYGISALLSGFLIFSFGFAPVLILWGLQELFYGVYVHYKVTPS